MKKYKFRLQTVLDLKVKKLEEKMLELSKILTVLNAEKDKLQKLIDIKSSTTGTLTNMYAQDNILDISEIQLYKNYIVKITMNISRQNGVIENVNKLIKAKQLEVSQALKEKKIFEKLKENEQNKYYKEIQVQENRELDDIAISRYAR